MYLANNGPHVGGASHYGQHLRRVVTLQYLFSAVPVYASLISTSTEECGSIVVTFLNSIVNLNNSRPRYIDISVYYDSSRDSLLHLV